MLPSIRDIVPPQAEAFYRHNSGTPGTCFFKPQKRCNMNSLIHTPQIFMYTCIMLQGCPTMQRLAAVNGLVALVGSETYLIQVNKMLMFQRTNVYRAHNNCAKRRVLD